MENTENQNGKISLKQSAVIAGVGLLLMAVLGPVANFKIIQGLIDPGDVVKTVSNIVASEGLFRLGIVLFLIVALLDIIVAWALYIFLIPINKQLSLLTAWLRIIYATVLLVVLTNLIHVLIFLGGHEYLNIFSSEQLNGQVMLSLAFFNRGWEFGLIIFGFHLLLLGYLLSKAGYMRKILGILVIIASLGYIVDGLGKLISANYHLTISMYTFIGEVVLMVWLLIRGIQLKERG